ncbi:MFS transporter [Paenibacillus pasadenensis]|uniref:MFS transporter n=1 Tax=Paenibacillus TaxID=44249 RepID=UPI000423FEB4|nr:MFS transporter [Paenibacillus pasadenensis]
MSDKRPADERSADERAAAAASNSAATERPAAPSVPPTSAETEPRPGAERLIGVLAFTMAISSMSAMMFTIVLPEMKAEFGLSLSQVSWMMTGYMLIYAIGSAIYGKLADLFRLKNLLTFGLSLFIIGSFIGLVSSSYGAVLAGRLIQSAGAAVVPAAAMIIPIRYFPPAVRGRALGMTASALALGNAIGPIFAALVVSTLHWRWLFCAPLLVLLTLPLFRRYLVDEPAKGGSLDLAGGLLLAGSSASLLLALTEWSLWYAAAGLVLALLLALRLRTAREPFLRPALFRIPAYRQGLLLMMLAMVSGYALPFLTPQLLSSVHELSPGVIGFAMVPAAGLAALLGRAAGRLADRKGNAYVFYVAASLLLTFFGLMALLAGASPWIAGGALVLGQLGQTMLQISLMNSVSRTLPSDQAGAGMGLVSLLNFLTGAAAGAAFSRLLDSFGGGTGVGAFPVFGLIYAGLFVVVGLLALTFRYRFSRSGQSGRETMPLRESIDS